MRTETKKCIKPFTLACSEGNTANHDQDGEELRLYQTFH